MIPYHDYMWKINCVVGILLLFSAAGPVAGQIVAQQLQSTGELVGTAGNNICAKSTVSVVRASATALTIGYGTSLTAPAIVRVASSTVPRTRILTAPVTLNVVGGVGVASEVEIWGVPTTNGLGIHVINSSGSSMACTPTCTVTVSGTPAAVAARAGVKLATWTVATGTPVSFNLTGGTVNNGAYDCNVQSLSLFNNSASAVTVTMATAGGLQLPWIGPLTISAYGVVAVSAPPVSTAQAVTAGIYQEGGMIVSASTGGVVSLQFNTVLYAPKGY